MQNVQFDSGNTSASLRASSTIVQPMTVDDGILYGTHRGDTLSTTPQFPHLDGLTGADTLTGDERDNRLYGGAHGDQLFGHDGNDILDGGTEADRLEGGAGNDIYYVDHFQDAIIETADGGYDIMFTNPDGIYGNSHRMALNVEQMIMTGSGWQMGEGNGQENFIIGSESENLIFGYHGNDIIYGMGGTDRIYGDAINEPYASDDILYGGEGNDFLYGGLGDDMLSGSGGNDTGVFADAESAVIIDLTRPYNNGGSATGEYLFSIENLIGSAFNDTMSGGQSRNMLDGGDGNDRLFGREGGDTIRGGAGSDFIDGGANRDVLTGGAGIGDAPDTFYFASASEAGDTITDFFSDHIALSAEGFGLTSIDDFAFARTTDPLTDDPTMIYDSRSGNLSWDADGSGAEAAVYFATLTGAPLLTQNDFLIV
jgi:serralysin